MATFCTQFHALLDELVEYVETWMDAFSLTAIAVEFPPSRAMRMPRETVRDILGRPKVHRVVFVKAGVDLPEGDYSDPIERYPDALVLEIGRLGPRGLEQSCLSTTDATDVWKKINKDLKRRTTAGSNYLHEENGVRGHDRNFRFSPGAKTLSESGTALRECAQAAVVFYPI